MPGSNEAPTTPPAAPAPGAATPPPAATGAAPPVEPAKPVKPADGATPPAEPAKDGKEKAAPVALKLPDGFNPDTAKTLGELAAEFSLKPEQAQKVADVIAAHEAGAIKNLQAHIEQTTAKWAADIKADKELGGANYDATMRQANQAMERFATPELKKALNESRFGDHPEVVRMMARIGKAIAEDTISGGGGAKAQSDTDILSTMYDHPTSAGLKK